MRAVDALRKGDLIDYANNNGPVKGCVVIDLHPETNQVTLDVPHGRQLVRITINADQVIGMTRSA